MYQITVEYIVNSKYRNIQHPPFIANEPIIKEICYQLFFQTILLSTTLEILKNFIHKFSPMFIHKTNQLIC